MKKPAAFVASFASAPAIASYCTAGLMLACLTYGDGGVHLLSHCRAHDCSYQMHSSHELADAMRSFGVGLDCHLVGPVSCFEESTTSLGYDRDELTKCCAW